MRGALWTLLWLAFALAKADFKALLSRMAEEAEAEAGKSVTTELLAAKDPDDQHQRGGTAGTTATPKEEVDDLDDANSSSSTEPPVLAALRDASAKADDDDDQEEQTASPEKQGTALPEGEGGGEGEGSQAGKDSLDNSLDDSLEGSVEDSLKNSRPPENEEENDGEVQLHSVAGEADEYELPRRVWLNLPSWYLSTNPVPSYQQAASLLEAKDFTGRYFEDRVIAELMYPSDYRGWVVEIGANDGVVFSSSLALEQHRGWRSVLVEGDPVLAKYAPQLRPNAVILNTVVCHDWGLVHFAPMGTQGGILETMPHFILWHFHPYLLEDRGKGPLTTETLEHAQVPLVGCVPLGWLLKQLRIPRIDFLMIDVNGADLAALSSVNFKESIDIDVVAVNFDSRRTESEGRNLAAKKYMEQFGYKAWSLSDVPKASRSDWMDDKYANQLQYFIRPKSIPATRLGL